MDLESYRAELINDVNLRAAAERDFKYLAFLSVVEELLVEAGEVSDIQQSYHRGTGRKNRNRGVDAYAIDDVDGSVRLFLAEVDLGAETPSLDRTSARALLGKLTAFAEDAMFGSLHEELDPSAPGYGLARLLAERAASDEPISRIRAYLVTDKSMSSTQRDWPEGRIGSTPVDYHIWDIERFHRLHLATTGREDLVIDLRPYGGLPCVDAGIRDSSYSAYLAVVPGLALARMYDQHGSRLLEGNVRSFLAVRGKVNRGIRNTIEHEPGIFFAYNNGIAATAADVTIETGANGVPRIVSVTDLQIVNGGQTTASIWNAWKNNVGDVDSVVVQMKLSIVLPEHAGRMIQDIAKYANTQNRVNDADFFANHAYHQRMEGFSRRLLVPAAPGTQYDTKWFYERSRGQYVNATLGRTKSQVEAFQREYPRDRVVTKTDLAKSEMCWRLAPHVVSTGAQKNFMIFAERITKEWDADDAQFHEDYFRAAMARTRLFKSIGSIVSSAPWYDGGYRANVVAYTMAKLAAMLQSEAKGHDLDYQTIWREDRISQVLTDQLTVIAEAMNGVILTPPGARNISEWAKSPMCWDRAFAVEIPLASALRAELVDPSARRDAEKNARTDMKMLSGILAQTMVVALGAEYWASVRDWGGSRRLLTPPDEAALRGATSFVPDEKQSKRLLALKDRLEREGMKPTPLPEH